MAARLTLCLWALALASPAAAECRFDAFGTIVNPGDPDCGGLQFRYTRSDDSGFNVALGYEVPRPVESLTPVDGFRSYQSLFERHQSLDAEHAAVAGTPVGQTVAGRDIWAYRVGDENDFTDDGGPEPMALINGTIHAREWQSPEAVTGLFERLVEMQDDQGIGSYLRDNLNLVVLPVLNIDGFLTTQKYPDRFTASEVQPREGRQRRKNGRNPATRDAIDDDITTIGDNFWGIDLNRNSPRGWGENNGSTQDPVSLVNRGPLPQSEPEILALVAAARELGSMTRLRFYTDVHSYSQIYFTPMTGNARRDAITERLVSRMRAVLNFKYRYGPESSSGIGLTSDYFARSFQVPAWTLETEPLRGGIDYGGTGHGHSGFILPASEVGRMRDEVFQMLLAGLYRQAEPPRLQAIEIRDAASGELRYAARWQPAAADRRRRLVSDLPLVPGRSYRLWLAFNKPMRWRGANGAVTNYRGQNVPLTPQITLEFPTLGDDRLDVRAAELTWLDEPGGAAAEGYRRYRDDALLAEFQVPADLDPGAAAPAVVSVSAQDMIGAALDGDPATRVDWSGGHWTGYEDVDGNAGDSGGSDCKFIAFVASDPAAAAPAGRNRTPCRAASEAPSGGAGGGSGGGGSNGGGSGGGGTALWLLLAVVTLRLVGATARG